MSHFSCMDKRPIPLAWAYYVLLSLLIACQQDSSPDIFKKHLADNPDIRPQYIYQSLLRLANVHHDPDFDKLIRDVNKIIIYFPPKEDSTYQIKDLRSTIRTSGYEELFDVRTAEKDRINLWVNESLAEPHYVGLLDTSGEDIVFEIDGMLDLEYISSLAVIDQKTLRNFLSE